MSCCAKCAKSGTSCGNASSPAKSAAIAAYQAMPSGTAQGIGMYSASTYKLLNALNAITSHHSGGVNGVGATPATTTSNTTTYVLIGLGGLAVGVLAARMYRK